VFSINRLITSLFSKIKSRSKQMPKQSRFLCIGGFLNGSAVKDQGDSFVCVENGKQVTYRKMEIFHQDSWDHDYYVCETTTDKQARNWVYDIKPD
jgi:hypothetical protein